MENQNLQLPARKTTAGHYCVLTNGENYCDPIELDELAQHLAADLPVAADLQFERGTLMMDGRLDLCKQKIGPVGATKIALSLERNTWVKSLMLGADGILNAGATAVADLLRVNQQLETIYLGCNGIDEQGVAALSAALENNRSVSGLWLKRNPVGREGATFLAQLLRRNTTLKTLDLVQTNLTADGVRIIAAALAENKTIENLYLSGNEIDAQSVAPLAELIKVNNSLKTLYLSVNRLQDEGAKAIAAAIRENTALVELGLASNGVEAEGAAALFESLQHHPTLQTLDLGFARSTNILNALPNKIGDAGAKQIAALLRSNSVLREINLSQNEITLRGVNLLLDALAENTTVVKLTLGKQLPAFLKDKIKAILERNKKMSGGEGKGRSDLAQIQSVYRTAE